MYQPFVAHVFCVFVMLIQMGLGGGLGEGWCSGFVVQERDEMESGAHGDGWSGAIAIRACVWELGTNAEGFCEGRVKSGRVILLILYRVNKAFR